MKISFGAIWNYPIGLSIVPTVVGRDVLEFGSSNIYEQTVLSTTW